MRTNRFIALFAITASLLGACRRDVGSNTITTEPTVHFTNATSGNFFIQNSPNSTFKIPIGITTPRSQDTKVTINVTSPTGATAGTHYNLSSTTFVIPAGKAVDSLTVQGLFSGYVGERRDTLVFNIIGGDANVADYNNTYRLVMQKYCNVALSAFTGTYTAQDYNATTNQPDGNPYTVTLTPGTTTGNSGTVQVSGLWGVPNQFTATLNWANPAGFSTNIADQNWFMHATYGQVRIKADGNGTFSSCDNRLTIRYEAYVSAGSFGKYYTTLRK